jgi:hypothetical protein
VSALWHLDESLRKASAHPATIAEPLASRQDRFFKTLAEMYPKVYKDFVAWQERRGGAEGALDLPRSVSPALHAGISEALNRFATVIVPQIVAEHNGEVIYAGGDDVLAASSGRPLYSNLTGPVSGTVHHGVLVSPNAASWA